MAKNCYKYAFLCKMVMLSDEKFQVVTREFPVGFNQVCWPRNWAVVSQSTHSVVQSHRLVLKTNPHKTCNITRIRDRVNSVERTGRIGFQTSWSWKLVLNWRTDRDKLCRQRIADTWTLGTRSDRPLTTCPIRLFVSITLHRNNNI